MSNHHAANGTGPLADADAMLRDLARIDTELEALFDALTGQDLNPAQAALEVLLTERLSRCTARGQLLAVSTAETGRIMLLDAAAMNSVEAIAADPAPFANGTVAMPEPASHKPQGKPLFRDTADYYRERMHIGGAETARRLTGARLLTPRPLSIPGSPERIRYPRLATSLRDGSADVGHLIDMAKRLETLQPTIDQRGDAAELTATVEASLAESARTQEAPGGKKLIRQWEEFLDSAGTAPSEEELRSRQGLFYLGERRGLHELLLRCASLQYETLETFFDAADNLRSPKAAVFRGSAPRRDGNQPARPPTIPRPEAPTASSEQPELDLPLASEHTEVIALEPDTVADDGSAFGDDADSGIVPDEDRAPAWACDPDLPEDQRPLGDFPTHEVAAPEADFADGLTRAQRRLNYLTTGCANTFTPSGSTGTAGSALNAQVVVHVDYQTLLGQLNRSGTTNHGIGVDPASIRQLACEANILPIVFGGENEVLNIGRQSRQFTRAQRDAVLAREGGGCFRPGCTMPAHTLHLHHVDSWSRGGETSVANALATCDHDHHLLHTGALKVQMVHGVPRLIEPDARGGPPPNGPAPNGPPRNPYWNPGGEVAALTKRHRGAGSAPPPTPPQDIRGARNTRGPTS